MSYAIQNWEHCQHVFEFIFGPAKKCRYCGAHTIASFDGTPKDIWGPIKLEAEKDDK